MLQGFPCLEVGPLPTIQWMVFPIFAWMNSFTFWHRLDDLSEPLVVAIKKLTPPPSVDLKGNELAFHLW